MVTRFEFYVRTEQGHMYSSKFTHILQVQANISMLESGLLAVTSEFSAHAFLQCDDVTQHWASPRRLEFMT